MTQASSFQSTTMPSAVLADPPGFFVPLFAVTSMSLSASYFLPPLGPARQRMIVPAHDDTVTLSALLIGEDRFTWKLMLETMADISKRGGVLESLTGGAVSGLVLVTAMTIRTDMQIQSLTFSATAMRRDVLEVNLSLAYVPRSGPLGILLNAVSPVVAALSDYAR
jgi:hypothetical protein